MGSPTSVGSPTAPRFGVAGRLVVGLALIFFLAVGGAGLYQYLWNFWLYRGFPPPTDPAFVTTKGTVQTIRVHSPAVGGRNQEVIVYLPPGYSARSARRYPVFYLLHGSPGRPAALLLTVRMGVVEDIAVAKHRAQPMILVMPYGSSGTFTDTEWANGYKPNQGWETFLARDVVNAIDARYKTIPTSAGRAIAGLSEGGYAALNIGLHHPREFTVLESWSGYQRAMPVSSVFGTDPRLLTWNSPLVQLPAVAPALRAQHSFVWFYWGASDRLRGENKHFARLLQQLGVAHHAFSVPGGHDWSLWRGNAWHAYLAAARRVSGG
jgi:enterochelin esterase-like enzyme